MIVSGENEEHAKDVADPGEGVQEVNPPRSVLGDEEVQQRQRDGVTGEHVVTTGPDALKMGFNFLNKKIVQNILKP